MFVIIARLYNGLALHPSFTSSALPHSAGNPVLIPLAMGASAMLPLPKILILALLASTQGALATATPFLPPVSQVEKVLKLTQSCLISQSFHFMYNSEGSREFPLPISSACSLRNENIFSMLIIFVKLGQCDRIKLTWDRGDSDTG